MIDEIAELQNREHKLKTEHDQLNSRLMSEIKDLQEQLDTSLMTRSENEDMIKKQTTDVDVLRRLNTDLTEKVAEQKAVIDQLQNQENVLKDKNNKAVSKLNLLVVQLKNQTEEMELALIERDESIERQQTNIADLESLVEELYTNLNDRRETIQELRQQLYAKLEKEILRNLEDGRLLASLQKLENDRTMLRDQNKLLSDEVEELKAVNTQLQSQNVPDVETISHLHSTIGSPQVENGQRQDQEHVDYIVSERLASLLEEQLPTDLMPDTSDCSEREEILVTELPTLDENITEQTSDTNSGSTTTSDDFYSVAKTVTQGVLFCGGFYLLMFLGYMIGSGGMGTCDPEFQDYLLNLLGNMQPPYS
ncbi:hypothetical protein WMY93_013223 [Mugilogobius chulae]|uniref:Uncharacterized protein n=1 Tax=Mugilogobius chulae TaxID=88201 RepID=A0AAW0P9D1_9GOBI